MLLSRALLGKTVCAFGEDGCGQYGTSVWPLYFTVINLNLSVALLYGAVNIYLFNYNSAVTGHILTDKNFEISLAKLLSDTCIEPSVLSWAPEAQQGTDFVMMDIDVKGLLS